MQIEQYSYLIFLAWKFPKSNSTHLMGSLFLCQDLKGLWGPSKEHKSKSVLRGVWGKMKMCSIFRGQKYPFPSQMTVIPEFRPSVATILPFNGNTDFFSEKLYDFKMLVTCSETGFRLPTANLWFSRRAIDRVQNIQTMFPTPDQPVQGLCTCYLSQCAWPGYKFDNSQISLTSHVVFVSNIHQCGLVSGLY